MQSIRKYRVVILFFTDILIICGAQFISAFLIVNNTHIFSETYKNLLSNTIILSVVVYEIIFGVFKIYRNITRYENGKDYITYIILSVFAGAIIFIGRFLLNLPLVSFKEIILSTMIIAVAMISYRVIIRFILTEIHPDKDIPETERKNILIIGAGEAAKEMIRTIKTTLKGKFNIIGLIDDNPNKIGYVISGVRILGNRYDIVNICKENKVDAIYFCISNLDNINKKKILTICQETGVKLRVLPGVADIIRNKSLVQNLRNVEIEDLLGREPIKLANENIEELIKDKCVLVTGGRRFYWIRTL